MATLTITTNQSDLDALIEQLVTQQQAVADIISQIQAFELTYSQDVAIPPPDPGVETAPDTVDDTSSS